MTGLRLRFAPGCCSGLGDSMPRFTALLYVWEMNLGSGKCQLGGTRRDVDPRSGERRRDLTFLFQSINAVNSYSIYPLPREYLLPLFLSIGYVSIERKLRLRALDITLLSCRRLVLHALGVEAIADASFRGGHSRKSAATRTFHPRLEFHIKCFSRDVNFPLIFA